MYFVGYDTCVTTRDIFGKRITHAVATHGLQISNHVTPTSVQNSASFKILLCVCGISKIQPAYSAYSQITMCPC